MFKTINDGKLPTRGSKYSAFVDLYANEDVTIGAGETKLVGLGIKIDFNEFWDDYVDANLFDKSEYQLKRYRHNFQKNHYLQLMINDSLATKGLMLNGGIKIFNLDYKDEIKIILHNPIKTSEILNYIRFAQGLGEESQIETEYEIKKGDRIAQIALKEHKSYLFNIDSDDKRNGGFGSTGEY